MEKQVPTVDTESPAAVHTGSRSAICCIRPPSPGRRSPGAAAIRSDTRPQLGARPHHKAEHLREMSGSPRLCTDSVGPQTGILRQTVPRSRRKQLA